MIPFQYIMPCSFPMFVINATLLLFYFLFLNFDFNYEHTFVNTYLRTKDLVVKIFFLKVLTKLTNLLMISIVSVWLYCKWNFLLFIVFIKLKTEKLFFLKNMYNMLLKKRAFYYYIKFLLRRRWDNIKICLI